MYRGADALRELSQFRPDVVLLDIGLPDIDGYEVARRARAQCGAHCPTLVALSGWGQEEDKEHAREAGIDVHLTKPVDVATLDARTERYQRAVFASGAVLDHNGRVAMTQPPPATPTRPPIHAAPRRVALYRCRRAVHGRDSTRRRRPTSLPQMAADLGESPLRLSVAVTAYLIALAILIPISGWVADRFGARRVYCASILVFVAGSLICGLSHSIVWLVIGRFVQGMGGSMMSPVGRLILTRGVEKRALVQVMNYMLLPAIVGPTVGPVIGGFITTYASWRWNFFINVPIGQEGLIMAWRFIPSSPPLPQARFDWPGFLLVGTAAAGLQALIEALGHQLLPARALVALAVLVALCAATLHAGHARRRIAPVIDPALFRIRSFSVAILAGSVARIGLFSTQILLPTLLQLQFGYSAFHSGLLTFLVSAGTFVTRPCISFVLARIGFRRELFWACAAASAMLAGFTQFRVSSPIALLASYIFVFGTIRSAIFFQHRRPGAGRHRTRRHGTQQQRGAVRAAPVDELRHQLRGRGAVAVVRRAGAGAARLLARVPARQRADADRGLRHAAPARPRRPPGIGLQPRRCLMRSATRRALAMMVRVGFTAPMEGKKLASVT